MTLGIASLLLIIVIMIIMLVLDVMPADTLSFIVMVTLIIGGFVSPSEGISGLSNAATVTILAFMILTVGLETTGVITKLGEILKGVLKNKEWINLALIMLIAGVCSAFVSSTAIVIVFLRILISLAKSLPNNLSQLLMPLSFAAIMGGSCTLMGTSTNLLVDSIAQQANLPGFEIFELTPIGLLFFFSGATYMLLIGRHMIPNRADTQNKFDEEYTIQRYLAEVEIEADSTLVDQVLGDTDLFLSDDKELAIMHIQRGKRILFPHENQILKEGDILLIRGNVKELARIRKEIKLRFLSNQNKKEELDDEVTLCEVIVRTNSKLVGKLLRRSSIRKKYDATPLAVKKNMNYRGDGLKKNLGYRYKKFQQLRIEAGDTVLMEVSKSNFEVFYNLPEFIVLQEHEHLASKTNRSYIAAAIVLSVVLVAATGIVPILVSTLTGCVAMFLTGCLDLQKAYRRVDWNIYFLLAGIIPLGKALDNTGASQLIAENFTMWFSDISPRALIATLYLATTLLSSIISNNATAVLFAPIAISIATSLNIDPRPLLVTIMFAANMSFLTPIGYQTNTLIYGVGKYKFVDFVKVGGGLSLIIWLLASWIIPYMYY